jgi:hypothetical protein
MSNTWIVDLRHYLDPSGAFANMPTRARLLAEYFASIVVDATANLDDEPSVRCRRRPGRRRCTGIIMSYPSADELERIHWHCPVCNDNGLISGWQDTLWDGREGIEPPTRGFSVLRFVRTKLLISLYRYHSECLILSTDGGT